MSAGSAGRYRDYEQLPGIPRDSHLVGFRAGLVVAGAVLARVFHHAEVEAFSGVVRAMSD